MTLLLIGMCLAVVTSIEAASPKHKKYAVLQQELEENPDAPSYPPESLVAKQALQAAKQKPWNFMTWGSHGVDKNGIGILPTKIASPKARLLPKESNSAQD